MDRIRPALMSLLLFLLASACGGGPAEYGFEGGIMGTSYLVRAFCEAPVPDIEAQIAGELRAVDEEMSTYKADSALMRFNEAPVGEWVPVSEAMMAVLDAALALSRASDGAFDVTIGPVVNLWGFGPEPAADAPPSTQQIEAALERVGYRHLELREQPPAARKRRDVYVDLSGIAKGHAVDRAAQRLEALGCASYLVELGGDLRAGAAKPDGSPWRIGIEVPDEEARELVHRIVATTGMGMATSGDYRNFAAWEVGERASHIMDPKTGRPATSDLRSVTVLHPSAKWADGYATLIDVLGPEAGHAFARERELPALLIVETDEGFEDIVTPELEPHLADGP